MIQRDIEKKLEEEEERKRKLEKMNRLMRRTSSFRGNLNVGDSPSKLENDLSELRQNLRQLSPKAGLNKKVIMFDGMKRINSQKDIFGVKKQNFNLVPISTNDLFQDTA